MCILSLNMHLRRSHSHTHLSRSMHFAFATAVLHGIKDGRALYRVSHSASGRITNLQSAQMARRDAMKTFSCDPLTNDEEAKWRESSRLSLKLRRFLQRLTKNVQLHDDST